MYRGSRRKLPKLQVLKGSLNNVFYTFAKLTAGTGLRGASPTWCGLVLRTYEPPQEETLGVRQAAL